MIRLRKSAERGHFDHGWLDTRHTFSFSRYYDPRHMGFRALRVVNEDRVQPGQGFGIHGHEDMEIVTYVLSGALAHRDSLGTGSTLRPGELQRMTPLSPIQSAAAAGKIGHDGEMPNVRSLRIPLKYLANLLTAGKEEPVALGLERMLAMRAYMRAKTIDGVIDENIATRVGLTGLAIEDMYQTMAIANYEDRFVIPTAHRELNEDAYDLRGACGFSFGNGCSGGATEVNLFGTPKKAKTPMEVM